MRVLAAALLVASAWAAAGSARAAEQPNFDDPMFRRCVSWLMTGEKGALIDNVCLDEFDLPSPAMFICARKVRMGFASKTDQDACVIILEEEIKKVRGGYVK